MVNDHFKRWNGHQGSDLWHCKGCIQPDDDSATVVGSSDGISLEQARGGYLRDDEATFIFGIVLLAKWSSVCLLDGDNMKLLVACFTLGRGSYTLSFQLNPNGKPRFREDHRKMQSKALIDVGILR